MSERGDILTDDMRRLIEQQRLCYVATADADGAPNLSAKGTLVVWDANTLAFADIRSPRTVANLRVNPRIEVNVVDPIARKGYRFKGTAAVHTAGPVFDRGIGLYTDRGVVSNIRSIVLIQVTRALPMLSPACQRPQPYTVGLARAPMLTSPLAVARSRWRGVSKFAPWDGISVPGSAIGRLNRRTGKQASADRR